MMEKLIKFFDKLEDKVRGKLSRTPILYAFIGGVGLVLFWRGVWHLADEIELSSIASIIIGSVILLITGVFVYVLIGNRIIMSGVESEKRLTRRTEEKAKEGEERLRDLRNTLNKMETKIDRLEGEKSDY